MSGWKSTDVNANNEPSYLVHVGRDQNYTNAYSNATVLVTTSRLANANVSIGGSPMNHPAHIGWNHFEIGTGPLASVAVSNVAAKVYTTEYLTITGANTGSSVPLVAANIQMVVTGSNTISFVINSTGSGFIKAPTITAAAANNSTLIFTATAGGRSGRIQAETLVALSTPSSTNANGAQPWFTGI